MIKELKRVVITGMGAVTPLGNSVSAFWKKLSLEKVVLDRLANLIQQISKRNLQPRCSILMLPVILKKMKPANMIFLHSMQLLQLMKQ